MKITRYGVYLKTYQNRKLVAGRCIDGANWLTREEADTFLDALRRSLGQSGAKITPISDLAFEVARLGHPLQIVSAVVINSGFCG